MTLLLDKKELVEDYLKKEEGISSAFSFANIYAWKDFFSFRFEIIDEHLCIFAQNEMGCFMYLPPLGPSRTLALFEKCFAVMEEINKGNGVSRMENVLKKLKPLFPENDYFCLPKGCEYFYSREDIVQFKGNSYKSKRSSFNQFVRTYEADYCDFESSMIGGCLSLYDEWAEERKQASDDIIYKYMLSENRQVHPLIFERCRALDMIGRVVKIDGRIRAYTFGYEVHPDVFCVFLEVANLNYKGLPVYIFRQFCQDEAIRKYKYVNVMDDLESENLRKTKLSYRPDFLMPLYVVSQKERDKE